MVSLQLCVVCVQAAPPVTPQRRYGVSPARQARSETLGFVQFKPPEVLTHLPLHRYAPIDLDHILALVRRNFLLEDKVQQTLVQDC